MKIKLNDREIEIKENSTIMELLESFNYSNKVAVFINNKHLNMSEYKYIIIMKDDSIRIIRILGGG